MTVNGGVGKLCVGAPLTPTKTMFQTEPLQLPSSEFRVKYCCCEPEETLPSTLVSAMKPPLDQPWLRGSSCSAPAMCMRRKGAACETAQRSLPPVGMTFIFSAMRQKVC